MPPGNPQQSYCVWVDVCACVAVRIVHIIRIKEYVCLALTIFVEILCVHTIVSSLTLRRTSVNLQEAWLMNPFLYPWQLFSHFLNLCLYLYAFDYSFTHCVSNCLWLPWVMPITSKVIVVYYFLFLKTDRAINDTSFWRQQSKRNYFILLVLFCGVQ